MDDVCPVHELHCATLAYSSPISPPSPPSRASVHGLPDWSGLTFAQVREQTEHFRFRFSGFRPGSGSAWLSGLQSSVSPVEPGDPGSGLVRANLLSGGVVHCSHAAFWSSFRNRAADICRGTVVLCDAHIAHGPSEGVVPYFELDYSSAENGGLPGSAVLLEHVQCATRVLGRAFPASEVTVSVGVCLPKIKTRASGAQVLAAGVHLVAPGLVVEPTQLRLLALDLAREMVHHTPEWPDVVDLSPYGSRCTLRANFAFKLEKCPNCRCREKLGARAKHRRPKKKPKLAGGFPLAFSGADETSEGTEEAVPGFCTPDCLGGRRLVPSMYVLHSTVVVRRQGGPALWRRWHQNWSARSVREELELASIVPNPSAVARFSTPFVAPVGLRSTDVVPYPAAFPVVFPNEQKHFRAGRNVRPVQCPKLAAALLSYLRRCFPYGPIPTDSVFSINLRSNAAGTQVVSITVFLRSFEFCLVLRDYHQGNRSFYRFALNKRRLFVGCFDSKCRAQIDERKGVVGPPSAGTDVLQDALAHGKSVQRELPADLAFEYTLPKAFVFALLDMTKALSDPAPAVPPGQDAAPDTAPGQDAAPGAPPGPVAGSRFPRSLPPPAGLDWREQFARLQAELKKQEGVSVGRQVNKKKKKQNSSFIHPKHREQKRVPLAMGKKQLEKKHESQHLED